MRHANVVSFWWESELYQFYIIEYCGGVNMLEDAHSVTKFLFDCAIEKYPR